MKISEKWLRDWVNPAIDRDALATQLTMLGLEIESVTPLAKSLENVVIGQVLDLQPHPDADRLRVCQVNVGKESTLTIVCGAKNVRVGGKYPTALVGAVLPNEVKIKRAALRGVTSEGMLCSEVELGLSDASEGIMELPIDAPIGHDFQEYFELDDAIFDLKITPNRGDCLSVRGLSREVAAVNNLPFEPRQIRIPDNLVSDKAVKMPIHVLSEKDCSAYYGQVIQGVKQNIKTPLWVQERLRRSGIRSIHPIVDITNYVMLELGQPLHAFDLNKINSEIHVRRAKEGETIKLLNDTSLTLRADDLVIADKKEPLALAGIMGGLDSAVTEQTTDIFLESACFAPRVIGASAKHYIISTDASYRFERGVDPQLAEMALHRTVELLLMIVGGVPGPMTFYVTQQHSVPSKPILLRRDRIAKILGQVIIDQDVVTILERLGFTLEKDTQGWLVTTPSHRYDVTREIDLIEEVARLYGYQNIVSNPLIAPLQARGDNSRILKVNDLKQVLVGLGYDEAVTYSFIDRRLSQALFPAEKLVELLNPISSEMAVMRTSLWPGLIQSALFNLNRQYDRIRLFEVGNCFKPGENGEIIQNNFVAGIAIGEYYPEQWGIQSRQIDFFDIKNDVEKLLNLTHQKDYVFEAVQHPALHPGKAALIKRKNQVIGYLGELHPDLQAQLKMNDKPYLFQLDLNQLHEVAPTQYTAPSKYPSIRRDLAFIIDQTIDYAVIEKKIVHIAGNLLKKVQLFDIYQGEGIDFGKKSVAVGLTFQLPSRTLIDQEVEDVMQSVMNMLRDEFNAILRV